MFRQKYLDHWLLWVVCDRQVPLDPTLEGGVKGHTVIEEGSTLPGSDAP